MTLGIKRDVLQDVVRRKAFGLAAEGAGDHQVTADVLIDHPRGEPNRRISYAVERLRAVRHLEGVAEPLSVEVGELVERVTLVGRQTGGRGLMEPDAFEMLAGTVAGMFVWMPSNPGGCCRAISSETAFPILPPCATYRVWPRRCIRIAHARGDAVRVQPGAVGLPEKP